MSIVHSSFLFFPLYLYQLYVLQGCPVLEQPICKSISESTARTTCLPLFYGLNQFEIKIHKRLVFKATTWYFSFSFLQQIYLTSNTAHVSLSWSNPTFRAYILCHSTVVFSAKTSKRSPPKGSVFDQCLK